MDFLFFKIIWKISFIPVKNKLYNTYIFKNYI